MQILQGQEAEAMWALGRDFLSTSTVYKGWKDNVIMEKLFLQGNQSQHQQ